VEAGAGSGTHHSRPPRTGTGGARDGARGRPQAAGVRERLDSHDPFRVFAFFFVSLGSLFSTF
jgi:hypothetical protein